MRIFSYIFWILILVVGITFGAMNSRSVEIHYYVGKTDIYLPFLLLIELVVGAILGVIAMLPQVFKLKSVIRKLKQHNKKLENELQTLKPTQKGLG